VVLQVSFWGRERGTDDRKQRMEIAVERMNETRQRTEDGDRWGWGWKGGDEKVGDDVETGKKKENWARREFREDELRCVDSKTDISISCCQRPGPCKGKEERRR
jgi:hypothetical protein